MTTQIHATCVDIDGAGVLLLGPSGSGKSDLALRLIDGGARLVADDRVNLAADGARVHASPPPNIAGMLEVRGIGIVKLEHAPHIPVDLAVELAPRGRIERLPRAEWREFAGVKVPLCRVDPFEAAATQKVRLAVRVVGGTIMPVFQAAADRE